jgi:hypothetical protein
VRTPLAAAPRYEAISNRVTSGVPNRSSKWRLEGDDGCGVDVLVGVDAEQDFLGGTGRDVTWGGGLRDAGQGRLPPDRLGRWWPSPGRGGQDCDGACREGPYRDASPARRQ